MAGQNIDKLPNGKFGSEGQELTKIELSKMLTQNPEAYQLYNKYSDRKRNSGRHLVGGIALLLGGAVTTFAGMVGAIDGQLNGHETYFVTGIVIGTVGLGYITASVWPRRHLLNKAVRIYNEQLPVTGMNDSLNLGMTQNGLGLVYNF